MPERLLYIGKLTTSKNNSAYLREKGYEVLRTEGLRPSLRALAEFEAHLVIVDTDSTSSINAHRLTHTAGRRHNCPFVILLTSNRSKSFENVVYDEVLVQPFTNRKLENIVRALLETRQKYIVRLGSLTLDRRTRRVRSNEGVYKLTPKQFQLLDYLSMHRGEIVSRRALMQQVWETNYVGDTRTLDVHIRWLREHLEQDPSKPKLIITHRGKGYSLEIEGPMEIGGEPIE